MDRNIITVWLILIPIVLLFGGCKSELKNLEEKLLKEKSGKFVKGLIVKEHKERIALLSIKYNIKETTLERILDEYRAKHDFSYSLRKSLGEEELGELDIYETIDLDFKETLSMLSSKYNLSKKTLASIIIDYKCMESKKGFR